MAIIARITRSSLLEAMNKDFEINEAVDAINNVIRKSRVRSISSNVMVGFPGETEATFEQTCHFIEELPFSYLHVFPYSDRPGTFSETLSDKVDATAKKERAARLLELARQKRRTFFDSWVGKDDQVIFEERKGENIWSGKSAHYLPVWVESPQNLLGKMMDVKITSAAPTHVWGEI